MNCLRLAVLVLALLGGCAVVSDAAGLAAGGGAGAATGNPAIGFAVGISVRASVDELRRYVVRRRQQGEQDAIAVVREYTTPLATYREVVFSVEDGRHPSLFTTSLCRQAARWKWAAAEPAVGRWGFLQQG